MLVDNANAANLLIPNVTVQSSVTGGISRLASDHSAISQAHENTAEFITPASSNSEPQSLNPAPELGSFPATVLNINPFYTALNYMNMAAQHLQIATIEASLLNGWDPRVAWLYPGMQEPQQKLKGRKIRFTDAQTNVLEQIFNNNKYLPTHKRMKLAQALALTKSQVNTWFQNRRSKWRRIMKYEEEEGDVPASVSTSSISHHQYRPDISNGISY
uniref:Homeobox domain-containing protein n=1 Tax=Acrobeloides nanus TaxID=290746 RepID=A0A914CKQ2_9BILA